MEPEIPIELVYLFIEASRDSLATLLQWSLVSKQCLSEARRYKFERIELKRQFNSAGEELVSVSHRMQMLRSVLTNNKSFCAYVRYLSVDFEPLTDETASLYAMHLPAILLLLPLLSSLAISNSGPHATYSWSKLPAQLKESIHRCLLASSITRLRFANFSNFSSYLVTSNPSLEHLSLENIWRQIEVTSRMPGSIAASQRLKSISVTGKGASALLDACIRLNPQGFSTIVAVVWPIANQRHIDVLNRAARLCVESLQEVTLDIGLPQPFRRADFNTSNLQNLPQVKKLTLSTTIDLFFEDGVDDAPGYGSHTSLFRDIVQSQHELEVLCIKARVEAFEHATRRPILIPNPSAWKEIDGHLCLPRSRSTLPQTSIYFTIFREQELPDNVHLSPEYTEQMYAIRTQLQKEANEVLCRSVGAGNTTIVIDIDSGCVL
ncbi:hypothetical protein D9611_013179 [Ephemerocybe angulata]|uniref:Uncharacterized protein n=1 Tax=Ephemerocybe angulata TaxID=980116 RepID=A0A8H5BU01_9AGAR|nr:hypothetical protein D9611_013179 [Tulosesus angulatus]